MQDETATLESPPGAADVATEAAAAPATPPENTPETPAAPVPPAEAQAREVPAADELADLRAEVARLKAHDAQARGMADECARLRLDWEERKEEAAQAKKNLDLASQRLEAHCRARESGTLFDGTACCEQPAPCYGEPAPVVDAWRSASVDELDIPDKLKVKLREASRDGAALVVPLATLGALADYTANGHNKLTDLDGIGKGNAEKIENALADWFAQNQEKCPPVKAAERLLVWVPTDVQDQWEAASAICATADGDQFHYIIDRNEAGLYVLGGDDEIVDSETTWDTYEAAQHEAEKLEAANRKAADPPAGECAPADPDEQLDGGGVPGSASVGGAIGLPENMTVESMNAEMRLTCRPRIVELFTAAGYGDTALLRKKFKFSADLANAVVDELVADGLLGDFIDPPNTRRVLLVKPETPTFDSLEISDPDQAKLRAADVNDFGEAVDWLSRGGDLLTTGISQKAAERIRDAAKASQSAKGKTTAENRYSTDTGGGKKPKRRGKSAA